MGIKTLYLKIAKRFSQECFTFDVPERVDDYIIEFTAYGVADELGDMFEVLSEDEFDDLVIDTVVDDLIKQVALIKPHKSLYIATDGVAPRCKMQLQRERRHKRIFERECEKRFCSNYKEKWNTIRKLWVGSPFKNKLDKAVKDAIVAGKFSRERLKIYFSPSTRDGEGEHKMINFLKTRPNTNRICVGSEDGDLFPLLFSVLGSKQYITLERGVSENDSTMISPEFDGKERVFININSLFQKIRMSMRLRSSITTDRFINDYIFLLSMNGNDFVKPLPFARTSFKGVDFNILDSYKNTINRSGVSLLNTSYQGGKLRIKVTEYVLKNIFADLADIEEKCMLKKHEIVKTRAREPTDGKSEENTLLHTPINNPVHPLYSEYGNRFDGIDYTQSYSVWRDQYYKVNFNCGKVADDFLADVCEDYLESLLFTQYYYMNSVPNWRWKRRYDASPLPSDIHYVLQKKLVKINKITFEETKPHKWYEQAAMTIPKHFYDSLLKKFHSLPTEFEDFFVDNIELNIVNNKKLIYADVNLPWIDDDVFMKRVNELIE